MKKLTLQECKDFVVKNSTQGFNDWEHFILCREVYPEYWFLLDQFIDEAATLFAEQACEMQRHNCWKSSEIYIPEGAYFDNYVDPDRIEINKKSIVNAPSPIK